MAAATAVDDAVGKLLAGKRVVESPILVLDLPDQFDQGQTVPLAVTVDGPIAEAGHAVPRVSVFAEGNPFPEVARVRFTPANGRASASTRIRLNAGRQEVVAVADLGDGRACLARRAVKIAIGGCGAEAGVAVDLAAPSPEPRVRLPAEIRRGEVVEVKTMISHRMETGLRTDADGKPIPRRIINRMECLHDGRPVFAADLTPAVAANAYLGFPVVARESAVLDFVWHEDGGAEYRASHALTVT